MLTPEIRTLKHITEQVNDQLYLQNFLDDLQEVNQTSLNVQEIL